MSQNINNRDPLPGDMETIRGAKLAGVEQLRATLLREVYANKSLRPYFKFGDLPIPFVDGQSPHILCIGDSGAGKTTTLRTLMSYLLPLPRRRVQQILETPTQQRSPSSPQEFSRSFTFQAVIYNAKEENVSFLAGLGFDTSTDLIILDPADERCWAWDIAKDVNSRDAIRHFMNLLIPTRAETNREDSASAFFESRARSLIGALIVSFRNAALQAGRQPAWTLRDLLECFDNEEILRHVLQWHDTPDAVLARLDIHSGTIDGILETARHFLDPLREAAERWDEAARLGRKIAFKDWALRGANTVLVLPHTGSNVLVNGPLNRLMLQALTELVVTHEYSFVHDPNGKHVRKRYFFLDELGDAGKLPSLMRLLTQGREFGCNCVLGLHAISQLEHTYGKDFTNTILALCPYRITLRIGDTATGKRAAETIGDCLRAYRKITVTTSNTTTATWANQDSTTSGVSDGVTATVGQSTAAGTSESDAKTRTHQVERGTSRLASTSEQKTRGESSTTTKTDSQATSHQASESSTTGATHGGSESSATSQADTIDLRQENAVYYSELMNFPDPATTGIISGYYHTPSLGTWQADLSLDRMLQQLEKPLPSVDPILKWRDDERISRAKPCTPVDFERLGMTPPLILESRRLKKLAKHNMPLLVGPAAFAHAEHDECNDEGGLPPPNFDF